jgi:2-methylcitrate dehydratase PrpD
LRLVEEHDIKPEEIDWHEAYVPPNFLPTLAFHEPRTGLEGKFSGEYCISRAILSRKAGLEDFTDEKVNEPVAQELVRKGKLIPDDDLTKDWLEAVERNEDYAPVKVKIRLKDGKEFEKIVGSPRGTAMAPLSKEELFAKYKDCAQYGGLTQRNIERSLELLDRFDELEDIAELMALIRSER